MEELIHRYNTDAPMTFLFTTTTGLVVQVKAEDLPITSPYSPNYDPMATISEEDMGKLPAEVLNYLSKNLKTESFTTNTDGAADANSPPVSSEMVGEPGRQSSSSMIAAPTAVASRSISAAPGRVDSPLEPRKYVPLTMAYNEYGELVSAYSILHPPHSKDMSTLQILRCIKKGYHHNYRKKVGMAISVETKGKSSVIDDDTLSFSERLSAWECKPRSLKAVKSDQESTPGKTTLAAIYNGPPRILEIGCGDGSWCFQVKKKYPDWIIEGIDDIDHWSCVNRGVVLKDFMESCFTNPGIDYFSASHDAQENPEFNVRNINQLRQHQNNIPLNRYALIRARDIFDKIENYKTFLDDVHSILELDGVVEFLEFDPRPRCVKAGRSRAQTTGKHRSGPKTDWTGDIRDRFKNKDDEQLATDVPGWMGRVHEDLKATLRPRDGIPGPNLKSWLEGAGFWDVQEHLVQLPIGGDSESGKLMKDYIVFKHSNEDEIPNLKAILPEIETETIESGKYYLNLHIVTGRKPHDPRAGDSPPNSTRQEMTASKHEVMARNEGSESNDQSDQLKRFNIGDEVTAFVHGLSILGEAPSAIPPTSTLSGGSNNTNVSPFLPSDGAAGCKGRESETAKAVEATSADDGNEKEVAAVNVVEMSDADN